MKINFKYFRLVEVEMLFGDVSKVWEKFGWKFEIDVKELCKEMM